MIIDAYNRSMSDELKEMLEEATGQPVEQHVFKAVIMSHTGPGTIGFGRIKKLKYLRGYEHDRCTCGASTAIYL